MDSPLTTTPTTAPAANTAVRRILRVFGLVRYRFFLYAGLLPYLLGSAWAELITGHIDAVVFGTGLIGIILAVVGVEAFNEYFDARMGTDRVFNPEDLPQISDAVLWIGVSGFLGAASIAVFLTVRGGWPILVFALLGGLAAIFYVAPPIRWAYRGLGEAMIGLSYGPWLVLGSVYLLAHKFIWNAALASLVPGLLVAALAVVNAIPDFHQDRLVGKRNLVVRLGRRGAVWLYLGLSAAALLVVVIGVTAGWFPAGCLAALIAVPLLLVSANTAFRTFETPRLFIPAIRSIVTCYLIAVGAFTLAVAQAAWFR